MWMKHLHRLFKISVLRDAHSHRFRDTFAAEILLPVMMATARSRSHIANGPARCPSNCRQLPSVEGGMDRKERPRTGSPGLMRSGGTASYGRDGQRIQEYYSGSWICTAPN